MNLKIDTRLLLHALAKTTKVAARKVTRMPAVALQMITTLAGFLKLTIVSDDVTLAAELPAVVEGEGQVFVPPALYELVSGLPAGQPLQFTHDASEQRMVITSGAVQQTLATLPVDVAQAGVEEDGEMCGTIRMPLRSWKTALDRLSPVLDKADCVGGVTCTALDLDENGRLTLVATDTTRLAMIGVPEARVTSDVPCSRAWIVRNRDLRLLATVVNGDAVLDEDIEMQLGQRTWAVRWSHYRMAAPYSERSFPNWRAIRPRDFTNSIEVDGRELAGILKLLSKVGDTKRATVRFKWNGDAHASLVAGNREAGTETDVALGIAWKMRSTPPGSTLALSARLLEPLVRELEPKPVLFSFTTPSLPAMVRPVDEAVPVEYLIMPVNL